MPGHAWRLILASGSPRRRQLLEEAGYQFQVVTPDPAAECGVCSGETPPELVARLAFQKAKDVARRCDEGIVLAADTVAECVGQILGKPKDVTHAEQMLRLLSGRKHHVYTGVCVWRRPDDKRLVMSAVTELRMDELSDQQLQSYLESGGWQGKAGAFGYQDEHDWLKITDGSASNVVGLPMELVGQMLKELAPPSDQP